MAIIRCAECSMVPSDDNLIKDGDRFLCSLCAEARLRDVTDALKKLLDRLDLIDGSPEYKGVWTFYHVHGMEYKGPTYEHEFKQARALVKGK
jgi:hypothetical protein